MRSTPCLMRHLVGRPPFSDLFGVQGRHLLAGSELPLEERQTVAGCLRQIEFLDHEIAAVERLIAQDALGSPQIRRLMTRARSQPARRRQLPRRDRRHRPLREPAQARLLPRSRSARAPVRLPSPSTHGHISKAGLGACPPRSRRGVLDVVRHPSPLHAFSQRIRARRGHSRRHRRRRAQARLPVLVPAHPRRGLRLRSNPR